jgi:inner membrane transporter RhtA
MKRWAPTKPGDHRPPVRRAPVGSALLVVGAAISQEVGAAFAVGLFAALGTIGAVFLRFALAGFILCVTVRPRLRGVPRRAWYSAAALAGTLTVMNLCFYNSLTRIPLGVAVTIEVLGPLILSVVVSTRRTAWLWALLALGGVALLGIADNHRGHADPVGFAFAAGAAASWAGYILASSRAAAEFPKLDALAVATVMGAVTTAPFAVISVAASEALRSQVAALGATVAVMCSVIPYSLELMSLRTLSPDTFAVLTCLSPVIAALAGWLVLGQQLGSTGYLAIVLVTIASIGAVRSTSQHRSDGSHRVIGPSDVLTDSPSIRER